MWITNRNMRITARRFEALLLIARWNARGQSPNAVGVGAAFVGTEFTPSKAARAGGSVVGGLVGAGLVRKRMGGYCLTPEGLDTLAEYVAQVQKDARYWIRQCERGERSIDSCRARLGGPGA